MRKVFCLLALTILAATAHGADIVVANVGPLSGPLAINGAANFEGSKACIEEENAKGGINGQRIRIVKEDDRYSPEETVRLVRMVALRDKPVAFINLLGSANVLALMKDQALEEMRIPALGVTPGADVLRKPGSTWIYHTQAGDRAQLQRIASHLATIGLTRIGVAYQDSPFGHGNMKIVEELAASLKLTITKRVPVPNPSDDLKAAAAELRNANAQAYLMIMAPNSGIAFVRDVRGSGDKTAIYGMSYVPAKSIVEKAGTDVAVGVGLAQVTPNTFSSNSALVRRFRAAMSQYAAAESNPGQLHLIGYLNCRVLMEALRATGANPNGERLKAALRRLKVDTGGYFVDFSAGNEGSRYVDIGVVTRDGRLQY